MGTIESPAEIPYNEIFWGIGGLLFAGGVCVGIVLVRRAIPSITVAVAPREERVRLDPVEDLRDVGAEEREIGVRETRFLAIADSAEEDVEPVEFICPISMDVMRDPVVVPGGQTIDRSSAMGIIRTQGGQNPFRSGARLTEDNIYPNLALKAQVERWAESRSSSS